MKWFISRFLRFQTSTTGSRKGSPLTSSRSRAPKSAILPPETVWRELVDGLPKGLPAAGDRGLDNTHTWGRTYWGGALFCLMADVEIHQRTNNRYGLQDALRGILGAGGNMEHDWPLARRSEGRRRGHRRAGPHGVVRSDESNPGNARSPCAVASIGYSAFRQFRRVRSRRTARLCRAIDYGEAIRPWSEACVQVGAHPGSTADSVSVLELEDAI